MPRILLVDDEDDFRTTVRKMLVRGGYEVLEANNGRVALSVLADQTVDLVLTDIIMPDMEGLETVRHIRALAPLVPIVAMSGGGRVSGMRPLDVAKAFGAQSALPKPFARAELLETIAEALSHGA